MVRTRRVRVGEAVGVSLYYSARRTREVTTTEREAIDRAVQGYPLEALARACGLSVGTYDGEAFCVYAENEPCVIFEGATKLPLSSEEAFSQAVQFWCRLLSEVRRIIPDAVWRVHVDDADIPWNDRLHAFDPTG